MGDRRQKIRLCYRCKEPAEELSVSMRTCFKCHKILREARARPYMETKLTKIKAFQDHVKHYFSEDLIKRQQHSERIDNKERLKRQVSIQKRKDAKMAAMESGQFKPDRIIYKLSRIEEYTEFILDSFYEAAGLGHLTDKYLPKLSDKIAHAMNAAPSSVRDIVIHQFPESPRKENLEKFAKFIAGNHVAITSGVPIIPWVPTQGLRDWMLIQVYKVKSNYVDKSGAGGFSLVVDVQSGRLAGQQLTFNYPGTKEFLIFKSFGINLKGMDFYHTRLFAGFQAQGYFELDSDNRPRLRSIYVTESQKKSNRELTAIRLGIEKCPYNRKPTEVGTCVECEIGFKPPITAPFGTRRCKYATHPTTLEEQRKERELNG